MKNIKIKEWLDLASKNIVNPGDSQDIHINELVAFEFYNKEHLFNEVLILANSLKINFLHEIEEDLRLFLYVALDSNSNSISGVPRTYSSLINRIDISYPPELVLYKEFEKKEFNKVELYKSCLPFKIKYDDSIEIVYRELRSYEELVDNECFTREVHLNIK